MSSVALIKYKDSISRALEEGLAYINGFETLESPVLIKPNICTISDNTGFSVSRVDTVESLVKLLLKTDETLSIKIIESDSESKNAEAAFKKFGYTQLCSNMRDSGFDVSTYDLSRAPLKEVEFTGDYFENPEIPEILLDAGYFISVAIPKTHYLTFITGALKNLFGVLPRKNQSFYHSKIDKVIPDLARIIRPSLNIIDARVGIEGWNGPKTRKLDVFIVGHAPVSVDATMARLMGFDPEAIRHIMNAFNYELGTINPTILGESVESVSAKFKAPK